MIELENVSKAFGDLYAVNNVTLKVNNGELFTLLGPNGAGKTTTVKMITGLIKPTRGKIIINGIDIEEFPEKAKKVISYIPDQPFLYPELTGREFIIFVSRLYGMNKKEINERMNLLIDEFRIGEWIDFPASLYSHGMRQKVIFIQALIHNPKIIVIDEPMVGLDPVSARIVKSVLRERVENGISVFMSTHSLDVAEEISDRVGVIDEGKLIEVGSIEKLLKTPSATLEDVYFAITEEEPNAY
jgi:ABC-2 type transport system ATP-binding protein